MFSGLRTHWRLSSFFLVFSIALVLFHTSLGTPEGGSYMFNLPWYSGFRNAFWAGELYPRFLPELWYGTGAVDFYFYGPLPFWFASSFGEIACLGCDTNTAFAVSGAWLILFSGLTFFILARRFFEPVWAGFGALIYMLLPYHYLVNWFHRQNIGEIASLVILPLLFLATIRLLEDRKGGAMFALSFAAIGLSHMPTTLIVIHLLAIVVTWTVISKEPTWPHRLAQFGRFALWGGLGCALSAIYWMPALALLGTVSPDMLYTRYYDATEWLLLDGRPEVNPTTSKSVKASLGLVVTTALFAGLILRKTLQRPSSLTVWVVGPSLFTGFLTTFMSYPVWKFWILNKIQFPWRTLTMTEISIALGAIVIAKYWVQSHKTAMAMRAHLLAAITGGVLVLAYATIIPRVVEATQSSLAHAGEFEDIGVLEYVPPAYLAPAYSRFKEKITPEASNADRFALFFEEMQVSYQESVAAFKNDAPDATLSTYQDQRITLSVDLETAGSVRIPIANWVLWRARTADGDALEISTDPDLGIIRLDLPAGRSDVELYLADSLPQKIGSALSLFAVLSLLGYAIVMNIGSFRSAKKALATSAS